MLLPVPPKGSMKPKTQIIEELEALQTIQYEFFSKMQKLLDENPDEEVEELIMNEIDSYNSISEFLN